MSSVVRAPAWLLCGIVVLSTRSVCAEPIDEVVAPSGPHRPTAVLVPDEPSGPALVVAGSGVMLAGWGVATAGVAVNDCMVADEEACTRRKFGLMFGGLVSAGLGGAALGIGLSRWRHALSPEPPDEMASKRAFPAMRAAGMTLTILGASAAFAGFVIAFLPRCAEGCEFGVASPLGPVLFAAGAAPLVAGLPLLSLGSHALPDEGVPRVRAHGLGLAADWRY